MMRIDVPVCLAGLALGLTAMEAGAGAGENGFAFLKLGVGTEAVGMGQAYASQATDATATYWNPAGLARVNGTDLLLMHNEFIADLRHEYVAAARSFGRHGLGISFSGLFTSDLEGRDEDGNITGEVGYNDLALALGYSYSLTDELSVGAGVKYLREFIGDPGATEDHVASGLAFDLGARYQTGALTFGATVRNLGADLSFGEAQTISAFGPGEIVGGSDIQLPAVVQGGVTYSPTFGVLDGGITVAVEGRQVRGEDFSLLVGTRYMYRDVAALSVGYSSGLDTQDVAFGAQVFKDQLRVGYAFVPFSDDLGNSHRLSIGYHLP